MERRLDRGESPRFEPEAEAQVQPDGQPTTASTAPGGASTGLRHEQDALVGTGGGMGGVGAGGAPALGPAGGSGTGPDGLGSGAGNSGGTRNLIHTAGRPADIPGTVPSEPGQTSEEDITQGANTGGVDLRRGLADPMPAPGPSSTFHGTQTGRI